MATVLGSVIGKITGVARNTQGQRRVTIALDKGLDEYIIQSFEVASEELSLDDKVDVKITKL